MIAIEITFEDGNVIRTGWNGTLEQARDYYVGKTFELREDKPEVKGVSVKLLD